MAAVLTLDNPEIPVLLDQLPDSGPDFLFRTGTIAFDSSYPTGGEALNLEALCGVDRVVLALIGPHKGYFFTYVYTATAANRKVKAWYADANAVADGALIEVANATSLATLTAVPVLLICQIDLPSELSES